MRYKSNLLKYSIFTVLCWLSVPAWLYCQSQWATLPPIPDDEGFAGLYAGVSDNRLICAGGANFPHKKPWEGGIKQWYDHIYILDEPDGKWRKSDIKIPKPLAYGVTVSFKDRMIMIGGSNSENHFNDVLGLEVIDGDIVLDESYPQLPEPLANMSGVLIDGVIYIAGGNTSPQGLAVNSLYMLDLNSGTSGYEWVKGPSWPGPARIQSVSASHEGDFYLFSGFNLQYGSEGSVNRKLLKDAYRYRPGKTDITDGEWTKLMDLPRGVAAAPSPAFTVGMAHIVIAGGIDEETLKFTDPQTHPGFNESTIAFNVQRDQWFTMESMPKAASRVTAPSVYWKDSWVIPNGERGPGRRSPNVYAYSTAITFGLINWFALVIYLLLMVLIGVYFSRKEISTSDYFLAGRNVPFWAAGISIYGTQLSAITFMAIPAIVYATDWRLAIGSLLIIGIIPIIVKYYIPHYRRMNITTAFEYLEHRFDYKIRALSSLTFIFLQLGRMGVVLYLPSIAISAVTGIDVVICITVIGIIATIYTVLGGIEAVIWTDVVQVFVLMGGAIACMFVAISEIDGGVSQVISLGIEYEKFTLFEWGWDYSKMVFWVAIVGFFFLNLISYSSDQVIIQRYLTVATEKDAARSLWINGIITLPGIFIFFGLGTILFIYYLTNPTEISSQTADEILPYFIVSHLPVGVAGLVISGIFAASMSSLDSSMNSIATAYISDFHKHFKPGLSDKKYLLRAREITILTGVFGTGTAILITKADVGFIFDFFQELLGTIGGTLGGIFVLAVFFKRATSMGVLYGAAAGVLATIAMRTLTEVNGYLYGAIGVISCVIVGLLFSLKTYEKKSL